MIGPTDPTGEAHETAVSIPDINAIVANAEIRCRPSITVPCVATATQWWIGASWDRAEGHGG